MLPSSIKVVKHHVYGNVSYGNNMLVKRIGEYFIHFHSDPAGRRKCPLNHLNCEEKASVGDCDKYFKGMVVLLFNILHAFN